MKTKQKGASLLYLWIFVLFGALLFSELFTPTRRAAHVRPPIMATSYSLDTDIDVNDVHLSEAVAIPDDNVNMLAQLIWSEARGVERTSEKAAVVWCVLNRVDDTRWGNTIEGVVTEESQFAYNPSAPITDEHIGIAQDVLERWSREKSGEVNVGRTLPSQYVFFEGDSKRNYFRSDYESNDLWDWSSPDPYEVCK